MRELVQNYIKGQHNNNEINEKIKKQNEEKNENKINELEKKLEEEKKSLVSLIPNKKVKHLDKNIKKFFTL